ncbi:MAG TPA: hypothetical protein VMI35_02710 [Puia sp.]|nr:hypothetical protein [Puia sp.]
MCSGRYIIPVFIIVLTLMFTGGCIKTSSLTNVPSIPSTDSSSTNADDSVPAAVTPVGTAVGNPVSTSIGPGGGTLTSSDGRVMLTIPAGALSTNTNISIQPVTNSCPGGIGLAYDLMPNGTKFAIPALLTYNYSDSDVNGTDPLVLYTAFQDSIGQWEIVDNYQIVDTVAKTVSFAINHFTIFELGPGVVMFVSRHEFHSGETGACTVQRFFKQKGSSRLVPARPYNSSQVSNWSVNNVVGGSSADGTIAKLPSTGAYQLAQYSAPSSIVFNREVELEVLVNEPVPVNVPPPGKSYVWKNKTVRKMVPLIGDPISFDVHVYIRHVGFSEFLAKDDLYNDSADFVVNVMNGVADVPAANIRNYPPSLKPQSEGDTQEGPGWLWIPDNTGLLNIVSASSLFVSPDATGQIMVSGFLSSQNTVYPQYTIFPGNGQAAYSQGGGASTPWPQGFVFALKDSFQVYTFVNAGPDNWGYTVTPKH